jgi:hypothetical protein
MQETGELAPGSAGSFFAWITILPDDDLTIAVVTALYWHGCCWLV